MSSVETSDIIETYLDRDLTEVFGEHGLQNIISSESNNELTTTEINLLAALIQRKHEKTAMEQVRKNIMLLEFRNVYETDDLEKEINDDDAEIENFVERLENLHDNLQNSINSLEKNRKREIEKLEELVSELDNDKLLSTNINSDINYNDLSDKINTFNLNLINK